MSGVTVRVYLQFNGLNAESHQDALDAVRLATDELRDKCREHFVAALEAVGATDVDMKTTVIG